MKNIIFNYEKDLEIINWLKALDIRGRLKRKNPVQKCEENDEYKFDTSVECSFIAKSGWLHFELCFQIHQVSGSSPCYLDPDSQRYTTVRDVQSVLSTKQFLEFLE